MSKRLNAATVAKKWADRTANSGEAMRAGVQAVTTAPTELAAQAKDKWQAGVQRAAMEGTFETGLRKVSLADWQKAMVDKGVANLGTGVRAAQGDVQSFMTEFLPYAQGVSDEIAAMPKNTLEDSKARAIAAIDKLSQFKRR